MTIAHPGLCSGELKKHVDSRYYLDLNIYLNALILLYISKKYLLKCAFRQITPVGLG